MKSLKDRYYDALLDALKGVRKQIDLIRKAGAMLTSAKCNGGRLLVYDLNFAMSLDCWTRGSGLYDIHIYRYSRKEFQDGDSLILGSYKADDKDDISIVHELRAKYYVRYVDDFILLNKDKKELEEWQSKIDIFLKEKLQLTLHPAKTKIVNINSGVSLVGFRVFKHHKLLKKSNIRRLHSRLRNFKIKLTNKKTTSEKIKLSIAGWNGYAQMGNTFRLREQINNQVRNIIRGAAS